MEHRIIVGIDTQADWTQLQAALLRAGARTMSEPTAHQPDAVVATLPAGSDATAYMRQVQGLPGVRYAEPDAMSGTC